MAIEIRTVENRRDIQNFIRLPYTVYRKGEKVWPAWVPPLNMDIRYLFDRKHNLMYEHTLACYWLAWEKGCVVGRIAAFIDHNFVRHQKEDIGFFGYFECLNRQDAAKELLKTAEAWLANRGIKKVIGPVNGSTNVQIGNQIDSFDIDPVIEMPYSPPYYANLYEFSGYKKEKDLYSYKLNLQKNAPSGKLLRVMELATKRYGIVIRSPDLKQWDREVDIIMDIWEDAWSENWGFTPWYEPEFRKMANSLKMIIRPEFSFIVEIEGEPVGFALPFPDINFALKKMNGRFFPTDIFRLLSAKKKATLGRVAVFGVRKAHQKKGIDAVMVCKIHSTALKIGHIYGEFSWILENNLTLRNFLEKWGCTHYRTHRIYEKKLQDETK